MRIVSVKTVRLAQDSSTEPTRETSGAAAVVHPDDGKTLPTGSAFQDEEIERVVSEAQHAIDCQ